MPFPYRVCGVFALIALAAGVGGDAPGYLDVSIKLDGAQQTLLRSPLPGLLRDAANQWTAYASWSPNADVVGVPTFQLGENQAALAFLPPNLVINSNMTLTLFMNPATLGTDAWSQILVQFEPLGRVGRASEYD